MRVVVSGGGTAGHIYPALALAEELIARGHEVLFAGTPQGIEKRLAQEAQLKFQAFEASGFQRKRPLTLISSILKILGSEIQAKLWLKELRPDCVVGFGGYASIPVARAAQALHIPIVVHEQNSVMGMTNKYLAKQAVVVCLTYPLAETPTSKARFELVGNPVRSQFKKADRERGRALYGFDRDDFVLLVFGGSLGAKHINEAIVALKDELLSRPKLRVVHISGERDFAWVEEALGLTKEEQTRYRLLSYQSQMADTMAAADLVVSRAGATSLAEISELSLPAVLVPFPFATADHQTANAQSLAKAQAAVVVADSAVEGTEFSSALFRLIDNKVAYDQMKAASQAIRVEDAAARLADIVEDIKAV